MQGSIIPNTVESARGLKLVTGNISVSAANTPISGYVLTATSPNTANWLPTSTPTGEPSLSNVVSLASGVQTAQISYGRTYSTIPAIVGLINNTGVGISGSVAQIPLTFVNQTTSGALGVLASSTPNNDYTLNYQIVISGASSSSSSSSSSLTPAEIGNLIVHFKADSISANDGDVVTTWADQANGYDASQSTTANKPLYKTNQLNGKPSVRFDGSDDYMSIASASAQATLGNGFSIFVVLRGTSGLTSGTTMALMFRTSLSQSLLLSLHSSLGIYCGIRGGNSIEVYPVHKNNTQAMIFSTVKQINASASQGYGLFIDGFPRSVTVGAAIGGSDNVGYIGSQNGSSDFYGGDVFEIVIFDKALNGKQFRGICQYFADKYGV